MDAVGAVRGCSLLMVAVREAMADAAWPGCQESRRIGCSPVCGSAKMVHGMMRILVN